MQRAFGFSGASLRVTTRDDAVLRFLDAAYAPLSITAVSAQHQATISSESLTFDGVDARFACMHDASPFIRTYHATQELFARFAASAADGVSLYAAALAINGRAALLIGDSLVGKTSTALTLADMGAEFLGDETVLLHAETMTLRALPRYPMVRETSLAYLPTRLAASIVGSPHAYPMERGRLWYALQPEFLCGIAPNSERRTLDAIFLLHRDPQGGGPRPMQPDEAIAHAARRIYGGAKLSHLAELRRALQLAPAYAVPVESARSAARAIFARMAA